MFKAAEVSMTGRWSRGQRPLDRPKPFKPPWRLWVWPPKAQRTLKCLPMGSSMTPQGISPDLPLTQANRGAEKRQVTAPEDISVNEMPFNRHVANTTDSERKNQRTTTTARKYAWLPNAWNTWSFIGTVTFMFNNCVFKNLLKNSWNYMQTYYITKKMLIMFLEIKIKGPISPCCSPSPE